jgi:hypothetical protein
MEPPNSKKGAQRLAGRLASLNRFISRSVERNLPFFDTKISQSFPMGSSSAKGFRRVKAILDRLDNSNSIFARGSVTPICSSLLTLQSVRRLYRRIKMAKSKYKHQYISFPKF